MRVSFILVSKQKQKMSDEIYIDTDGMKAEIYDDRFVLCTKDYKAEYIKQKNESLYQLLCTFVRINRKKDLLSVLQTW